MQLILKCVTKKRLKYKREERVKKIFERTIYSGVQKYTSTRKLHRKEADTCYYIVYRDHDGKTIREKCGWASQGWTLAKAQQRRIERLAALQKGEPAPQKRKEVPTFGEVATRYIQWIRDNNPGDHGPDVSRYNHYIFPSLAPLRLDEVTPLILEDLKSSLHALAPQTVKHVLSLVRRIINKAITWDLWNGPNPVQRVKLPRINNARVRFLSYDEAKLLLAALKDRSITVHDMSLLALHCGLRLGEVTALKAYNVDLDNRIIHISDSKNGTHRVAHMTTDVAEMLATRLKGLDPDDYVFRDRRHKGRITGVSATFDRAVDSLGYNEGITDRRQRVVYHTLRHTYASWLVMQGTNILVVKELMGHKTLAMTERYSHLAPSASKAAVAVLEETMRDKS